MKKKAAAFLGAIMVASTLMGCAIPANTADRTAQTSAQPDVDQFALSNTVSYEQMSTSKTKAATGKMISGEITAIVDGTVTLKLFESPAQGKKSDEKPKTKPNKNTAKPSSSPRPSISPKPKASPRSNAKGAPTMKYSGEVASITLATGTVITLNSGGKTGGTETKIDVSALKTGWTLQVFYKQDGTTISKIIAHQSSTAGTIS